MKALVVDDSSVMRRIHQKALEGLGYEVQSAGDGQEGYEKLVALSGCVLVITDLHMPVCDGIDFIKKVRQDNRFARLPILMVTSDGVMESVARAVEAGANDVLIKPFSPAVFAEKIRGFANA